MAELFLKIANMSIAASWLVLVLLVLRLLMRKAPKWVLVLLWGFVAVRLLCPFGIESALSLIPSAATISPEIMMDRTPEIATGIETLDRVVNPVISEVFAPEPIASANPLQILIPVAANLWLLGAWVMLLYAAVSDCRLRRRVAAAVRWRDNIFQSEHVDSPFVQGVLKPRIYLPFAMDAQDREYVIAHEQAHICRRDHWWKPLGFLLLAIHWFNPLLWYAYTLFCRDMELACDEKVIRDMDGEQRADYTQALVACSVNRRMPALAFGEVGVKERVQSVMNYRKPARWAAALAVLACAVVAVCFLTDPVEMDHAEDQYYLRIGESGVKEIFLSQPGSSGGIVNADGSLFKKGDRVWLEELDGIGDLRGISIQAIDEKGRSVYLFAVSPDATDEEIAKLVKEDRWLIAPESRMKEQPVDDEVLHLGLNAEIIEIDAEAEVLYVKDMDEKAAVFGERCAIDCSKAMREHRLIYVNYSGEGDVRSIDFADFQVGDAVIIDLYDSQKQQAFHGHAVAEQIQLATQRMNQPPITHYPAHKALFEPTPAEEVEEKYDNEEFVITHLHYETVNGEWKCEGYTYRYRLEISGRMPNAAKNSSYIVLSNTEDITFEQTVRASGISSNLADYFDPAAAVIVGYRLFS
ncbi:MAG: hypothetical protein IKB53_00555 [Oscillospiraceae bacterium]|nr:hypothetical protein [Oscillospiraceae bacterium]